MRPRAPGQAGVGSHLGRRAMGSARGPAERLASERGLGGECGGPVPSPPAGGVVTRVAGRGEEAWGEAAFRKWVHDAGYSGPL